MTGKGLVGTVIAGLLLSGGTSWGQGVILYRPVVVSAGPAPVIVHRPVFGVPSTIVVQRPVVDGVVAASPVTVLRPVAPPTSAIVTSPTVVYRPSIAEVPVSAPVITYSPVVVPAVAVGRPVIVSTKVYVPGQPIRNFFRAITP